MRLFTKFFLFGMLVFGLAFSASGYFLLHYSLESSLAREADFALKQFQYDKFTVQSAMLTYSDVTVVVTFGNDFEPDGEGRFSVWQVSPEGGLFSGSEAGGIPEADNLPEAGKTPETEEFSESGEPPKTGDIPEGSDSPESGNAPGDGDSVGNQESWDGIPQGFFSILAEEISVPAAFFAEDKTPLYSEIEGMDISFLESLSENAHGYQFQPTPEGGAILTGTVLYWNGADAATGVSDGQKIYFVTQWDISKTVHQQETLRQYFLRCYLAAVALGMALLGILSALLTGPLKRMSRAARRMAEGDYGERLAVKGGDEVGELAGSLNQMADAVEEKIGELSRAAREKEDFAANFAHELKTPLTSIIGYADTIYRKELPREDIRKASWHIWNEGMRLEALSRKMMELTVLGRQEFPLQEMPADELLQDVAESLSPVLEKRQIRLRLQAEPAYVMVEYDLLKTLLLNLVDNAVKAGAGHLEIRGYPCGGRYRICVRDDGCGMEKAELSRITEAFYMVDKARSRKQHGAGLGLALADRIAGLHGSRPEFCSEKGKGTEVSFDVACGKGGVEDEDI